MNYLIRKIALYGDSLFRGVVLSSKNHRYHISDNIGIEYIAKQYALDIINNSKFGYTIDRGFKILKQNIQKGEIYDAILLEYGGNDCNFNWNEISSSPEEDHYPYTPKNLFHQTYLEMIQYIKDHGIKPVLSTLPPLCSERFFKWICKDSSIKPQNILKWLGDINAIYRYQEMYSREIEYIAFKTNTPIIDIRGAFLEKRHLLNYMCEDGMHPNEEGQKLIQQAFLHFLEQNKRVFSYC